MPDTRKIHYAWIICLGGTLMLFASIGLGIAFVPDYCLTRASSLFKVRITEELPARQLVIAHNAQLPVPQAARAFIRFFTDAAGTGIHS